MSTAAAAPASGDSTATATATATTGDAAAAAAGATAAGDKPPEAKVEPGKGGAAAGGKADAKPEEPKRPDWGAAVKAERKAREAVAAADKKAAEAEARAKKTEDEARARVADLETKAKELQPVLEMLSKKDAKGLLAHLGFSAVDIAHMVAEEGKPPTVEEIEARAVEKATAALREEQKKRDEEAAAARKKTDEEARVAEKKADDARFATAVNNQLKGVAAALEDEANAEKFAIARDVDELLPAIGLDRGSDVITWGKHKNGEPRTVEVEGGTVMSRAALGLILKVLDATGQLLPAAEAIERVQKSAEPVLQKLVGRAKAGGEKPAAKPDQKKNGGAGQPTLTTRSTTGPVIEPAEDDDSSVVDEASVLKAARAALPHLRPHLGG
jgi:hypothetical protein